MKLVAALAAAALVVTSPGLSSYEAAAQIVVSPVGQPVQGQARPLLGLQAPRLSPTELTVTKVSLSGSLPSLPPRISISIPVSAKALPVPGGPMPLAELLAQQPSLTLPQGAAASMTAPAARESGRGMMDRILGVRAAPETPAVEAAAPATSFQPTLLPARHVASRIKDKVVGFFQVLPEKQRNGEFWKFILGQAAIALGAAFHQTALPKFVAPAKENSQELGYNRAGNWLSQAAASSTTGPLVDRVSVNKLFVATYLGRAVLLMSVPILFFHGWLSPMVFLGVIVAHGFLQAMGVNGASVAFNRILAEDEAHYNRANAVFNLTQDLVGAVGPLLAGTFIGLMDAKLHHALAGNALSYGVYAVLMAAAAAGFGLFLRLPRDRLLQARRDLAAELKGNEKVRGVGAARSGEKAVLVVEVSGDPAAAASELPFEFAGFAIRVVEKRGALKELMEGLRMTMSDRFLRLTLLFSTLYCFAADALEFSALPSFIRDVLGPVTVSLPWLAKVPVVGGVIAALTSGAGMFGLYLAAASLGMSLAALVFLRRARRVAASQGALERQGKWSSYLFGLGALATWGVFFLPFWGSVAALLLGSFLQGPSTVIWAGLTQKRLQEKFPHDMGKVYSFMNLYQLVCSVLGVLFFGWLMGAAATAVGLWVMCLAMTGVALLNFIEPFLVFPMDRPSKGNGPRK